MARGLGHRATQAGGESTAARESIERRWFRRQKRDPQLADLVTATALREEPFHRWLSYKQAFAPALVRMFLDEIDGDAQSAASSGRIAQKDTVRKVCVSDVGTATINA